MILDNVIFDSTLGSPFSKIWTSEIFKSMKLRKEDRF